MFKRIIVFLFSLFACHLLVEFYIHYKNLGFLCYPFIYSINTLIFYVKSGFFRSCASHPKDVSGSI
ncbi:hypothetical protein D1164_06640 [Mariniphaga sediminis]|uniref:Lipoprotein n=1 Tax=Mariniphaga sediminis TaxID=1628158 RepID=A0A399D2Z1_9BACT|nr:hypothetical protein D1164_06640 [Mariniphaga sediminis]